jgi:Cu(I)/Ag(I) efflux system membrane protein CusA/SilA
MDRIITLSVRHPWIVVTITALLTLGGWWSMRHTPLDALPDLSEPQVILAAEWMGQSPQQMHQQVVTPVVAALSGQPGVATVRGYAMSGMAFVYVVLGADADAEDGRRRVLEQLPLLQAVLPPGAQLRPGPDASGVGWAMQYALRDVSGSRDLSALTLLQEHMMRPALQTTPGVAEIATVGGWRRTVVVRADPIRMAARGVVWSDLQRALSAAPVSGTLGIIEASSKDTFVQLAGIATTTVALADLPLGLGGPNAGLRIRDVASVADEPAARLGTAELGGEGEAVGGIVVVRQGQNTLEVLQRVHEKLATLRKALPAGVEVVVVYDRSGLIERSVATLTDALIEQMWTVAIIILLFLWKIRSALVPILLLPAAVLLAFAPMRWLGVTASLMSLGGMALAIGDLVDAAVVLVDDVHKKLEAIGPSPTEAQRVAAVLQACRGVGPPIFFSLLLLTVAFLPVFALEGQAARLFGPLAWTKTLAMGFASLLAITAAPALLRLLVRGQITAEKDHWLSRLLMRLYRPFAWAALHNPWSTLSIALLAVLTCIPLYRGLGSEFMPALTEGDLLYMPTTMPGLPIAEAQRQLQIQDRIFAAFPEVQAVMGKAGRADTATDPAPMSMVETVVRLRPRSEWRRVAADPWWQDNGKPPTWLPAWSYPILERTSPSRRPMTTPELIAQMQSALDLAGWTASFTQPIRTRIDMLSTGVRTAVGLRVYGPDIATIDRTLAVLEVALREVPGARSVFAEQSGGARAWQVHTDASALARYGLVAADVQRTVQRAIAGEAVAVLQEPLRPVPVVLKMGSESQWEYNDLLALPVREARRQSVAAVVDSVAAPAPAAMNEMAMAAGGGSQVPVAAASQSGSAPADTVLQPAVALAAVATVVGVQEPAMLLVENGQLTGTVYIDLDESRTDPGTWLAAAKARLATVPLPERVQLGWTGQYEQMASTSARLQWVVPLTLLIMFALLLLNFRALVPSLMVMGSVPFAAVGAVVALWALEIPLSTAVWVGVLGLLGVAAETGIIMIMYLDETYAEWQAAGKIHTLADLRDCALEGAVQRVRPKLMTVSMNIVGLAPLLWATGTGSEVLRRLVAPMVGGLFSSTLLTLEIIPVLWVVWRGQQLAGKKAA